MFKTGFKLHCGAGSAPAECDGISTWRGAKREAADMQAKP
jgi:hypothetical protein